MKKKILKLLKKLESKQDDYVFFFTKMYTDTSGSVWRRDRDYREYIEFDFCNEEELIEELEARTNTKEFQISMIVRSNENNYTLKDILTMFDLWCNNNKLISSGSIKELQNES
jgi:hypothetical protein